MVGCYYKGAFELEMLPAQIPLTLEHLFPTPSSSNAGDRFAAVLFLFSTTAALVVFIGFFPQGSWMRWLKPS